VVAVTLLQTSVAWLVLHAAPHPPQLLVVVISVSQPFATLASQFAWAESHAIEHFPPAQLAVPPAVLHAFPHAPQLFTSVFVSVSQPFVTLLSQFP